MFLCHDAKVTLFPDIRCAKIFWLGVGHPRRIPPAPNILEKEKRRRAKSIDQIAETEAAAEGNYSEEHENMLSKMEKAMEKLPEDDRRLIELHYYNKLPTKDIANKTGMSQANVLVKLHRIRERLKKIIENEGDE